jgi:uncharacterized protein (TIGR02145 family)
VSVFAILSAYAAGDEAVIDIDSNSYTTVTIGSQTWMGQNLNVTHNARGDSIARYCYDDREANCDTFGGLYTWYDAMDGSAEESAQGICPDGWHIPSDNEWKALEMALGMSQEDADGGDEYPWRGTDQGTQMSAGGSSGFDFLQGGRLHDDGSYWFKNQVAYFWTSTNADDTAYAWRRCLANDDPGVGRWSTFPKTWGFSLRCMKDDTASADIKRNQADAFDILHGNGNVRLTVIDIFGRRVYTSVIAAGPTDARCNAVMHCRRKLAAGAYIMHMQDKKVPFAHIK